MNSRTILNLLNDINDGLQIGKKVIPAMVEAHLVVLVDVPDEYYSRIKMRVIQTWKFNSIPKPAHISEIYESIKLARTASGKEDPQEKIDKEREKEAHETRKARHRIDVLDFTRRIVDGRALTDKQKEAYDRIKERIDCLFDEDVSPKERLKNLKQPYAWAFTGLYMDILEGRVYHELDTTKGDMFANFNLNKSKPYNEDEYKKKMARQRSLNYDNQRPGA